MFRKAIAAQLAKPMLCQMIVANGADTVFNETSWGGKERVVSGRTRTFAE